MAAIDARRARITASRDRELNLEEEAQPRAAGLGPVFRNAEAPALQELSGLGGELRRIGESLPENLRTPPGIDLEIDTHRTLHELAGRGLRIELILSGRDKTR